MGPCGCFQTFSDGGKACTRGNECLAGACIIGLSDTPNEQGLYIGKCPKETLYGKIGDKFEPLCTKATIESGVIIRDARGCMY